MRSVLCTKREAINLRNMYISEASSHNYTLSTHRAVKTTLERVDCSLWEPPRHRFTHQRLNIHRIHWMQGLQESDEIIPLIINSERNICLAKLTFTLIMLHTVKALSCPSHSPFSFLNMCYFRTVFSGKWARVSFKIMIFLWNKFEDDYTINLALGGLEAIIHVIQQCALHCTGSLFSTIVTRYIIKTATINKEGTLGIGGTLQIYSYKLRKNCN